jgi:Acetyltransferases, including N-acetylases of ribosomal proteins
MDGPRISLRPLQREDLNDRYLSWVNDPDVTRYTETGAFPQTFQDLENFYRDVTSSRTQVILAIVEKKAGQHIGNVKLGPINSIHRRATLGILIGEKQFWGNGFGADTTRLAVEYAFYRLNLRRVDLGGFAEHESAVHCYENVGFKVEGRFRQDLFQDGEYKDRLWMGLLRSEYAPAVEKRKGAQRKTRQRRAAHL